MLTIDRPIADAYREATLRHHPVVAADGRCASFRQSHRGPVPDSSDADIHSRGTADADIMRPQNIS